jgi:CoA:oxalate CoA-transferase
MPAVLDGIRVLDFSRYIAAPVACGLLADVGAEVIRIEAPGGEEDRTLGPRAPSGGPIWYAIWNHHRRGITLNLRAEAGQDLALRLIKCADVVVHNFVPGTTLAQFLDYERLRPVNPSIVVAAVSAYGQTGPWANLGGFDSLIQGISGVMSLTGLPGGPPLRTGLSWVDFSAAYNTALGVMFALYHRARTGLGQLVDVGLLDTAVFPVIAQGILAEYLLNGAARRQIGNETWYGYINLFRAKDGWITISPAVDSQFRRLVRAIGRPELAEDPRFATPVDRFAHREVLNEILEPWVAERTLAEVTAEMERAHVPVGPANTVEAVAANPQLAARGMIVPVGRPGAAPIPTPGFPLKLSRTPASVEGPAPEVGEHNDEVFGALLGLDAAEIAALRERQII